MQAEFYFKKFGQLINEAFLNLQIYLKCILHTPLLHAILIHNLPVLLKLQLSCILKHSF